MGGPDAASQTDSVSIEAGAGGVKVTAQGGSAASVGSALLDLLSPFTNVSGLVGDRIAAARRNAAIKAAAKAIQLLKEEGIASGDVPPKILLPWLEGVSLEVEDDETLQSAWAGLLARAVKSSDAANVSYIETLKRIGKAEADLLVFFATDTSPFYSSKFYGIRRDEDHFEGNPLILNLFKKKFDPESSHDVLREMMDTVGLQAMSQVIYYAVDEGASVTTPFFDKNEHAVSNLEHLGLIRIRRSEVKTDERSYSLIWFEITKYAFDLFWACQGKLTGGERAHFTMSRK